MTEMIPLKFLPDQGSRRGKSSVYRQCILVQEGRRVVTWVENRLAFKGKTVEIKDKSVGLEGFWMIDRVYKGQVLTGAQIDMAEDAYRHHREATDV